jgi:hypothetical protein
MLSLGLSCFLGELFGVIPSEEPDERVYSLLFLILWNLFFVLHACYVFRIPSEIYITGNDKLILRSIAREVVLSPDEITEIECDYEGDWIIYHKNGTLRTYSNFRFASVEFTEFRQWLIKLNPDILFPK